MKTKLLCITLLTFTVLIFGANHYAARNDLPAEDCETCNCTITITVQDPGQKWEPSCSVVFKGDRKRLSSGGSGRDYTGVDVLTKIISFSSCDFVIFCDPLAEAKLTCMNVSPAQLRWGYLGRKVGKETADVWSDLKCAVFCERREDDDKTMRIDCKHWEMPGSSPEPEPPVKTTPKTPAKTPPKPTGKKPRSGNLLSMFLGSSWQGSSIISSFVPAIYSPEPADEKAPDGIISDSTRWRLLDGEAGIEQGMLMVMKGEAEAQSFCTGDNIRLAGPNVLSLPTCQTDLSGRWQGVYVKRLAKGAREPVTVSLNLRNESGSLRGELTTTDGPFNIVKGSQSGSDLRLEAERTGAGTQAKIYLNGRVTKGVIVFGGSVTGFVRRVYIADSALPLAILNQPYTFPLTAFAPEGQALTFRLATPAIIQPEQITWNKDAQDLRGRNGERFTYACPAFTYINPVVSGTDVYTDDSSICKAAVHSGVITAKPGGVVTIQIKPDAGSYTASTRNGIASKSYGAWKGSFVFVKGESSGGERGRLPKGISFDNQSGTFSGTPTELGSFDISVVADDGAGNVFEQPLTFTVKKLVVTNRLLPDGFVGQSYGATLKVTGGQPPYRFSGSPPKGLQLDPSTGEVSGKPSSSSAYDRYGNRTSVAASFEVTISDSQNNSESQKVSLSVRGATIMNSHFLPDGKVGVPYRTQFQAVGTLSPINWVFGRDEDGSIGLLLNEKTGELSGTPTKAGNFFIEVRAEAGSSVPSRKFALTIK
jgi:LCCL domain/Putative Ig domain